MTKVTQNSEDQISFEHAIQLLNQLDYRYPSMHEASDEFITNKNIELKIQSMFHVEEVFKAYIAYKKYHIAGQITRVELGVIIEALRIKLASK